MLTWVNHMISKHAPPSQVTPQVAVETEVAAAGIETDLQKVEIDTEDSIALQSTIC